MSTTLIIFPDLLKAHVSSYTRKDGAFVKEHDDKRQAAKPGATADLSHPAYNKMVSMPDGSQTIPLSQGGDTHGAVSLMRANPEWSAKDHADLSLAHKSKYEELWPEVQKLTGPARAKSKVGRDWKRHFAMSHAHKIASGLMSDTPDDFKKYFGSDK
jgi:hypothetical protein